MQHNTILSGLNLCDLPCNPVSRFVSEHHLIKANVSIIRRDALLQFNKDRAELEPIMKIAAYKIQSPRNKIIRNYSLKVLAPALRRYHEAHVALRQLSSPMCFRRMNEAADSQSCRPDIQASFLDSNPLDWAYYALAEKTVVTKKKVFKELCLGRELEILDPAKQYPSGNLIQMTETNLKILEDSRAQSVAKKIGTTTVCVKNFLEGVKVEPRIVLNEVFAAWSTSQFNRHMEAPLKGLGHIRIIIYGTDYVAPTVEHRSFTGLPAFSPGYIRDRFNLTNDQSISAAWANFSDWQTLEHAYALNESLMKPDSKWSASLQTWEFMGLDFKIFAANLFARHPRVFPLPLGAPDHFHSTLERYRLGIRKRETDFKKRHMLLLNFKPFGGPNGPSSSERQAIYRLAALGDPENGVKPWTFANILPSKGDDDMTDTLLQMNHHYGILASSHFVLSPRGNGLDCFRTWEALALGTIPIVKKSGPFDAIYEGLPVLLVDRWEDVTLELLERILQEWRHRRFPNLKRISIAGWLPESL